MVNECLLDEIEELFVEKYERIQFGIMSRFRLNEEEAEDILMDAYQKAVSAVNYFKRCSNLETWLFRIVTNTAIDYLKYRSGSCGVHCPISLNFDLCESLDPNPEEDLIRRESISVYEMALEQLTPKGKEVLLLVYEGCSTKEIADSLNIPIGTVLTRIYHARRHYLRALDGEVPESVCRRFNI